MDIKNSVAKIIEDVARFGDRKIIFYTKKFDGIKLSPHNFKISEVEIKSAIAKLKKDNKNLYDAIKKSAENIEEFHSRESKIVRRNWTYTKNGITVGEISNPVESVAVYVPGGRYSYPSSVLMTAIPAKVAGVKKIIMITPPKNITPAVLFAASISGINEVYRIGGVQSIAAVAFGTKTIPKVDMIVGPGNAYVTEAKRQLFGVVGIDMLAGPSEVVIIADKGASSDFIANDLLAQVEHDPSSRAFLFSESQKQIDEVKKLLPETFKKNISFKKASLALACRLVNKIAPEHLELLVRNPQKILDKIKNAGAVFLGYDTPTALGDYYAGPSHVLPTGTTAKFSSGISTATFIKKTSIISSDKNALKHWSKYVMKFAESEGLNYHSASVKVRCER